LYMILLHISFGATLSHYIASHAVVEPFAHDIVS